MARNKFKTIIIFIHKQTNKHNVWFFTHWWNTPFSHNAIHRRCVEKQTCWCLSHFYFLIASHFDIIFCSYKDLKYVSFCIATVYSKCMSDQCVVHSMCSTSAGWSEEPPPWFNSTSEERKQTETLESPERPGWITHHAAGPQALRRPEWGLFCCHWWICWGVKLVIFLIFFHEVTTEFSYSQTSRGYWLLCDEWNWSVVVLRAGESVA